MTRSLFLSVLTIGAALSMTAGVALAGSDTVPAAQILNALKPKSATRGLSAGTQVDPAASAKEASFLSTVRNRQTRSLSMGERQMYASALLKALVDESDIEFPVFIDSPMQKFDRDHAENVIKEFYPNVSKQVVLFPLIHKELTESEFNLLKPKISKAYLIHNFSMDASKFVESVPDQLIKTYNELYAD
jgi:hypothetical protein